MSDTTSPRQSTANIEGCVFYHLKGEQPVLRRWADGSFHICLKQKYIVPEEWITDEMREEWSKKQRAESEGR